MLLPSLDTPDTDVLETELQAWDNFATQELVAFARAFLHTNVFILAAGEAKRYFGISKQLIDIGGETVIARTIRQCRNRGHEPLVVTNNDEIMDAVSCNVFTPSPGMTNSICDTLLTTRPLWNTRNVVLLGDVIYSAATMEAIITCNDPIRVFGDTWEIFGVSFADSVADRVETALHVAKEYRLGKLRYFYKQYCGFDMDEPESQREPLERNIFYKIDDWTVDIDCERDHNKFMREVVKPGRLDDLP